MTDHALTDNPAPVLVDIDHTVAVVTLNRPRSYNALSTEVKDALLAALQDCAANPEVRAVVLTGQGKGFCVGQDLGEHAQALISSDDPLGATLEQHYCPLAQTVATMEKPVLSCLNGVAAGAGVALALACDLRYASSNATFTLAFSAIGLACDTGTSFWLSRTVGIARAKELLLLNPTLTAQEAFDMGLVTAVVDADNALAHTLTVARTLAQGPTRAYGALRRAVTLGASSNLHDCLALESELMKTTGATQDHRNAVPAFLAKQRPTFTGQ